MAHATDADTGSDIPTGDEPSAISPNAFWVLSALATACTVAALFSGVRDHWSTFVLAALAIVLASQTHRSTLYNNVFGSGIALVAAISVFAALVQP